MCSKTSMTAPTLVSTHSYSLPCHHFYENRLYEFTMNPPSNHPTILPVPDPAVLTFVPARAL